MVLYSPLWRCTWSIFVIWKPKSILLMATLGSSFILVHGVEAVFIHFLSSTSLSAKQHQSGSGQSSCTHHTYWFRTFGMSFDCSGSSCAPRNVRGQAVCCIFLPIKQSTTSLLTHLQVSCLPICSYILFGISSACSDSVVSDGVRRRVREKNTVKCAHEACLRFEVHTFTTVVWSSSDCVDVYAAAACGSTSIGCDYSFIRLCRHR